MKYLLRKCEIFADADVGKFHFTSTKAVGGGRYFTISARKLFHIRRKPNISLERLMDLWYNRAKKVGVVMADSKLRDLSIDFAVKVIKMCDSIKGHYSLVNQLERSSTSIGANIHEANYAHNKADFVAKFQIALKECYETEYWLELFVKSELLDREIAKDLYNQCGTIRRILIASVNTAKENIK